ncbi:NAD-dependent epimerase/dehydratase family protein [Agromyces aureus]|uniref:NAD-dependent epimerase/dehydratase domain-containing protein n=1 Tax=Agromyces aureus TaxID=453304 RepID=A0A191WHI7_9MICO|nr:NAD(P)-dependent oxidoreductase [Agromyces aureus]ANJ27687.1 hypothetical protein ATC03_14190 [Agromyces aureus]
MTSTRVLVVGGGGPLGAAVTGDLQSRRIPALITRRIGPEPLDVSNHAAVTDALAAVRPESVIYLANPGVETIQEDAVGSSVDDLRHFAARAAESDVERIIFASSAAVYGTSWTRPVSEDDHADGPGLYADLKRRSEHVLREVAETTRLTASALRIFNIFGPGFSRSLVSRLASGEPRAVLQVSDSFVRDYVHAADVARALVLASEHSHPGFRVLNIGTGIATDNIELSRLAAPGSYSIAASPTSPSYCVANVARAREALRFQPTWSVAEYLAEAAARRV